MTDTLSRILTYKREEVAERRNRSSLSDLQARIDNQSPPRGFTKALIEVAQSRPALIAEIKKASPSKGLIREDFDPAQLAHAYAAGGAACLSVLTDSPSFRGSDDDLIAARAACALPCLRKDFMVDVWQIYESRALGADAILVILAAVSDATASELVDVARNLGMDALIETHDAEEVERALRQNSPLIGVNNRNLKTFVTDLATTEKLAKQVPNDRILVAESGITGPEDIVNLQQSGAKAFLIGESLMRQKDVSAATRAMLGLAAAQPH